MKDLNKAQFYNFSIQAENQVGVGPPTSVNATTLEDGRFFSRGISENTVKHVWIKGFLMFSGGIEKQHWAVIG